MTSALTDSQWIALSALVFVVIVFGAVALADMETKAKLKATAAEAERLRVEARRQSEAECRKVEERLERHAAEHFAMYLIQDARRREWEEQERILWELEAPCRKTKAAIQAAIQAAKSNTHPYQ